MFEAEYMPETKEEKEKREKELKEARKEWADAGPFECPFC